MKYTVAFLLCICFVQTGIAQDKKDANDYYITKDGERVDIAVKTKKVRKTITYSYISPESGRVKLLKPEEISEFRDGEKRFISRNVVHSDKKFDNEGIVFLEEIVEGRVSYYYSRSTRFKDFLMKDGEIKPLFREFVAQTNVNSAGGSFYVNRFLDVYYDYFGDCDTFDYAKKYKLGKKSVKKVVETYNSCFESQ